MNKSVGIIGLGFVGNAIYKSFQHKNIKVSGYDKFKNIGTSFNSILDKDYIFLCLPTLFNKKNNSYDLSSIYESCDKLNENNFQGIIILKSTVEPNTTNKLCQKYINLKFIHNPEFLSGKTAYEDFHNQIHIVLGKSKSVNFDDINMVKNFYKNFYPNALISICDSDESESMKIFCNSFYAVKIQFFNELYLLCKKINCNYDNVLKLMLNNNWINPMHTKVPGTDGKLSYGGGCFPKDTEALLSFMKKNNSNHQVLESCILERNMLRML